MKLEDLDSSDEENKAGHVRIRIDLNDASNIKLDANSVKVSRYPIPVPYETSNEDLASVER